MAVNTNYADYIRQIPTSSDFDAAVRRGRQLHSRAIGSYATSLVAAVANPVKRLVERSKQRRTADDLSRLSDRMLRDIGVTRGDILAVARGDVTRPEVAAPAATADITPMPVAVVHPVETGRQLAA